MLAGGSQRAAQRGGYYFLPERRRGVLVYDNGGSGGTDNKNHPFSFSVAETCTVEPVYIIVERLTRKTES